MAIADIISVTGTIVTGQGEAGNVTAFDGTTFLNTIKQDANFVAYADALGGPVMWGIYFIWSDPWEVQIVLSDYHHYYTITGESGPYTLAQLGVTANIVNSGFDSIELGVEYSEYEFPPMFYTPSKYNQGIVTNFDVDTFVNTLNQDSELKEFFRTHGGLALTDIYLNVTSSSWNLYGYTNWGNSLMISSDGDPYSLAQLGFTVGSGVGQATFYLAPDDGYTLPPMIGVIAENGDHTITAFDADTFTTTMNRNAYAVSLARYYGCKFLYIDFQNGTEGWEVYIAMSNDYAFWFEDIDNIYTLAQLGITADLSEDGYDLIYLVEKKAGVTYAKSYGSVGGESKRVKKLYGSVNGESVEIKKLYGSVNGESKLIYQAMPYYPASVYGTVYYKPDAYEDTVCSVVLQSEEEFMSLGNYAWAWATFLGNGSVMVTNNDSKNVIVGVDIGQSITEIPPYFLYGCSALTRQIVIPNNVVYIGSGFLGDSAYNQPLVIPSSVSAINGNFLESCRSFNQTITIPNSVTTIGYRFMASCSNFNQSITLPNNLTSIDNNFLYNCGSFNQALTLPSSLTSIGSYFMYDCKNMVSEVNVGNLAATIATGSTNTFSTSSSSAACYTTGISIAGSNRAAWLSRFPNRTSSPYRKLLNAGH